MASGGATSLSVLLGSQRVVPLVEVDDDVRAIAVARILADHGMPVIEIALRTPGAIAAIEAVRSSVPGSLVGAGTVVTADQLSAVTAAGAAFAVSPGWSLELLAAADGGPISFVPGVATVSEMMQIGEAGIREVKFFHAEAAGGVPAVSAMSAVMPSMRFLPTGGIHVGSAPAYLAVDAVFAVGGSWVCPAALIREGAWDEIASRVRAASSLMASGRP